MNESNHEFVKLLVLKNGKVEERAFQSDYEMPFYFSIPNKIFIAI